MAPRALSRRHKRRVSPDVTLSPQKNHSRRRPPKRALIVAPCDIWSGNKPFCRYCNSDLSVSSSESHLLYQCTGIPNSIPLPKSSRRFPKGLMKRLAEISAVPDPGGEIVGGLTK